jgi:hypothetical protein
MTKVCPNPIPWNAVYQRLIHAGEARTDLPKPPVPLILNGWVFSNDVEKMERWQETLQWAQTAGCAHITNSLSDDDFYHTEEVSSYRIGPLGGPMHRSWDFEAKQKPEQDSLNAGLQRLIGHWNEVAAGFSTITQPLGFTGTKARRLVIAVKSNGSPPWGAWDRLSHDEEKRRTFTAFRNAINATLRPNEVDHIDFIMEITQGEVESEPFISTDEEQTE